MKTLANELKKISKKAKPDASLRLPVFVHLLAKSLLAAARRGDTHLIYSIDTIYAHTLSSQLRRDGFVVDTTDGGGGNVLLHISWK